MVMKKQLFLLCMMASIGFVSCNRDMRTFTGDYSYKLSGDVMFTDSEGNEEHTLHTQIGQLNILKNKAGGNDCVLVTVNQMNGSVYTFAAKVKGDSLILDDHECVMEFSSVSANSSLTQVKRPYKVHVAGRGVLHDNMLVLDEKWSGVSTEDFSNTLIATSITVLAEQND